MYLISTIDLKLSAVLVASGIPLRGHDPITCFVEFQKGRRHEQYTFWFDVGASGSDADVKARGLIDAFWKFQAGDFTLDLEHPIYYMIAALQNRETMLHWIRSKVEPIKRVSFGNKDILLSERAGPELKAKLRKMAAQMGG